MPSILTFAPDSTKPTQTVSYTLSDDEMRAAASFVRDQNAGLLTPRYTGVGHLLVSNLQQGLLTTLVAEYPNPTITSLQAQLNQIQAQVTALLAASNPPVTGVSDPVVIAPF